MAKSAALVFAVAGDKRAREQVEQYCEYCRAYFTTQEKAIGPKPVFFFFVLFQK